MANDHAPNEDFYHGPTSDGCEQTGTHEKCCAPCTCGARQTMQHNLGCPMRALQDRFDDAIIAKMTGEHYGRSPAVAVLDELRADGLMMSAEDDARHIKHALERAFKRESAERKAAPLWSGCMRYFPNALLAIARLSKKANDKHNPGEPLHWSEHKSNDHGDCIARHQLNPEEIDPEFDEPHAVMVAWRALAQLELIERKRRGK